MFIFWRMSFSDLGFLKIIIFCQDTICEEICFQAELDLWANVFISTYFPGQKQSSRKYDLGETHCSGEDVPQRTMGGLKRYPEDPKAFAVGDK